MFFLTISCRLRKEYEVLEKFVKDEAELKEAKEYEAALEVLSQAKELLDEKENPKEES